MLFSWPKWKFLLFVTGLLVAMHTWSLAAKYGHFNSVWLPWLLAAGQGGTGLWLSCRICRAAQITGLITGILALLFLSVAFAVVFPPLNRGELYAGGSDRDEALNAATKAFFSGRYPYTATAVDTATGRLVGPGGNPISPLPGALFLAAPFVLLIGEGAWQNLFWLGIFWWYMGRSFGDRNRFYAAPATGALLLLLSSPTITGAEVLTGGDLMAISVALLITCGLLQEAEGRGRILAAGGMCGLAIATRPHFFMIWPLLVASLYQRGIAFPLRRALLAGGVAVGITLPFWLWSPADFSPLHASSFALRFTDLLPYSHIWLYGLLATAIGLLSILIIQGHCRFETAAGILFLIPPAFLTLMASLQAGAPDWRFAFYGLSGWLFLIAAAWQAGPLLLHQPAPLSISPNHPA